MLGGRWEGVVREVGSHFYTRALCVLTQGGLSSRVMPEEYTVEPADASDTVRERTSVLAGVLNSEQLCGHKGDLCLGPRRGNNQGGLGTQHSSGGGCREVCVLSWPFLEIMETFWAQLLVKQGIKAQLWTEPPGNTSRARVAWSSSLPPTVVPPHHSHFSC